MRHLVHSIPRGREGVAAVEFALIAPVLLLIAAGLSDFPLALWDRIIIAAAVESGANYAFAVEQNETGNNSSVSATDVGNAVRAASSLTNLVVTVSAPATYCVSSGATKASHVTVLTSGTSGNACADGQQPGLYMTISATYHYAPLLPVYGLLAQTTLGDTATVRLQ
ncbi:TadE/TadG family type IV pilus assembly protein [Gluconacetobacter tumulisoli]|uniref:Pilus assembly protein n=1 Tax=Gluconacetobacter tumulisoli TaxID=1286189 RepID=A0A7W4PML6_9PROT|nr:TadE/TadG family type IV pilus assembly protein [Gluconacetobacter tumulisoli]MBB2203305.1 pilus assembly protein [Gluconacetobacter tumulisoli]